MWYIMCGEPIRRRSYFGGVKIEIRHFNTIQMVIDAQQIRQIHLNVNYIKKIVLSNLDLQNKIDIVKRSCKTFKVKIASLELGF